MKVAVEPAILIALEICMISSRITSFRAIAVTIIYPYLEVVRAGGCHLLAKKIAETQLCLVYHGVDLKTVTIRHDLNNKLCSYM